MQSGARRSSHVGRTIAFAVIVALTGAVFIGLTRGLNADLFPDSLEDHRGRLIAAQVAFFGVFFVELVVRAILQSYERQDARQAGVMVRAVIRTIAYMVIAVAVLSILAANPALAVGVGSMMGLVIGFSTQNIISNVFAGMFLAIGRPFNIDDDITVSGNTGKVVEFTIMHTVIDTEANTVLIPNSSMLTQVILRSKGLVPHDEG
jgi:small-conductance mechanosensitive channel